MPKVAQTRDMQAGGFGFAVNVASSYGVPQNTTCTIAGLVVTSAAVTARATNDAAGMMLLASTNATFGTAGTVNYGVVQSSTSGTTPAFTVDAWYTLTGAAGGVPVTGFYVLLPVVPPFWFMALSDDTAAVSGAETGIAIPITGGKVELSTNGLGRAQAGTVTRTVGSTACTLANTFTYTTNATQNIGRVALLNSNVLNQNYVYFVNQVNSGTPAVLTTSGDTFTPTYTLTLG